jgi:hypothetical protein
LRYLVRPLKGSAKGRSPGPRRVKLGRFETASLFIDNASAGWCFGEFGPAPCDANASRDKMILIFELPAYTGNFDVTLSGGSASFSSNQFGGGTTGVSYNGPDSLTVSGCSCVSYPTYQPILVQGSGGEYQVTTSVPMQVAPDNYSYVPVGPDTPVSYSFGD